MGTEPMANIEPGIMMEKMTKVCRLKQMRLIKGDRKKMNEQRRTTNSNPYLLHILVENTNEITMGMTEISRIVELVWGVMCDPW